MTDKGATAVSQVAGASRRRRLGLAAAAGLVLLATTGCTAREVFLLDLPEPGTVEAEGISSLWEGVWVTAWPVGLLVWGLMIFCIVVYSRRHRKDEPEQTAYNLPIEVMYTVAPLLMVFGIFAWSQKTPNPADIPDPTAGIEAEQATHTVNVIGYRWSWGFNYVEEGVYDAGTPDQKPTLWVPVNERVRFELTSPDVIHSFWVPQWLYKLDVIPGKLNQFATTPTMTGEFAGRCAELCGVDHARMLFTVRVVPRAEYDAYIADLRAKGQVGALETGRVNRSGEPGPEGRTGTTS